MKMAHGKYWKKHRFFSIYYVMNITMEELIRIIREELNEVAWHLKTRDGKPPEEWDPNVKAYPKASVVVRAVGKKELYKSPEEEEEASEEEIDVSSV